MKFFKFRNSTVANQSKFDLSQYIKDDEIQPQILFHLYKSSLFKDMLKMSWMNPDLDRSLLREIN